MRESMYSREQAPTFPFFDQRLKLSLGGKEKE